MTTVNIIERKHIKPGSRIKLKYTNDRMTKLIPGSVGTVEKIEEWDSESLIWVNWDNGEHLALLSETDKYDLLD